MNLRLFMTTNQKNLTGIFAPVVTPFQSDELRLDYLKFNLKKLEQTKLKGYLALGSNGEFKSLSDKEQLKVLEVFASQKTAKIVMVGTGCESTKSTIEKSKAVFQMGFKYVSILPPSYFAKRMNDDTIKEYYLKIADAIPIPLIIYNAPGFTAGIQIAPKIVVELSQHPNIVGIKDSSPSGPGKYLNILDPDEDFFVLAGSTNFLYSSMYLGATGGILSLGNIFPDICCHFFELLIKSEFHLAKGLHFQLARLNGSISGTFGVAGVKAAMNLVGYKGGEPRHPLKALKGEEIKKIEERMITERLR
jgi:4-hydroxy-2-oxoglutarate aldolase